MDRVVVKYLLATACIALVSLIAWGTTNYTRMNEPLLFSFIAFLGSLVGICVGLVVWLKLH